jgi:hypothetical protein
MRPGGHAGLAAPGIAPRAAVLAASSRGAAARAGLGAAHLPDPVAALDPAREERPAPELDRAVERWAVAHHSPREPPEVAAVWAWREAALWAGGAGAGPATGPWGPRWPPPCPAHRDLERARARARPPGAPGPRCR